MATRFNEMQIIFIEISKILSEFYYGVVINSIKSISRKVIYTCEHFGCNTHHVPIANTWEHFGCNTQHVPNAHFGCNPQHVPRC